MRMRLAAAMAALLLGAAPGETQPRKPPPTAAPLLQASRTAMAGSMLSVAVGGQAVAARIAIARPDHPADRAILVVPARAGGATALPVPGEPGRYELRLTREEAGQPAILARQPLEATPPSATVNAPARVTRGKSFPVRGIGPNGEQDRVVLVPAGAPPEADGPSFFPAENSESTLDAPAEPGAYELRYVMNAPLAENRVLARQAVTVE